jgi:energy-converting hydrogenase Eha subunit A
VNVDENVVKVVVALCITAFGITCIMHGLDHAVVAAVAGVLGGLIGHRVSK